MPYNPETKLRFELQETVVLHPYFQRRNPVSDKLEPKRVLGRGVWDHEQNRWAVEPSMKAAGATFADVRAMNGLPPLTVQKVVAALRKAGHHIARYNASGQVRGWGDWSPGAQVTNDNFGRICVKHVINNWSKLTHEQIDAQTDKYAATLTAGGLTINRSGALAVM